MEREAVIIRVRWTLEMLLDRRRLYGTSEYLMLFLSVILIHLEKTSIRYTFRTTCQESENVDLEDGRTTVFLNTRGKNESEVPGELVTFLQYMKEDLEGSEKEFHDPYVEQLQKFIRNVKGSREMEERFMIFEEMLKEERAAGFAKGRAEGVAEGEFLRVRIRYSYFAESWNGS